MGIWSRVSQLLWQEAEMPVAAPAPSASREAAGVPEYLRKAVRLAITGSVATLLAAQIVGIRLVVPAEAADYTACITNCRNTVEVPCHRDCDTVYRNDANACCVAYQACLRKCPGYPTFRTAPQIACQQSCSSANKTCENNALSKKNTCDKTCLPKFQACVKTNCGITLPPGAT